MIKRLRSLGEKAMNAGHSVQTLRIGLRREAWKILSLLPPDQSPDIYFSLGKMDPNDSEFVGEVISHQRERVAFCLAMNELEEMREEHVDDCFLRIAKEAPKKLFNFSYGSHIAPNSPFFPGTYAELNGFSIGLQSPSLLPSSSSDSFQPWFTAQKNAWNELMTLFSTETDFLGIDSSTAPLFSDSILKCVQVASGNEHAPLSSLTLTNLWTQVTHFIKNENPRPIGQCGLMIPVCEDERLAKEYERGAFSLERNLFLSLHCGLGVDVYPIPWPLNDLQKEKMLNTLKLIRALSMRYGKPLYARFVTDGKTAVGEKSDFQNEHLVDVIIQEL